jgi:hypothetical protein
MNKQNNCNFLNLFLLLGAPHIYCPMAPRTVNLALIMFHYITGGG